MLGDFADVQQAVGSREKFDEGAKLREAHNLAEVVLADFGAGSNVPHHLQSGVATRPAGGEDVHRAVFQYVNLHASGFDDGLDFLSARAYEVADLVLRNLRLEQARRKSRNLRT